MKQPKRMRKCIPLLNIAVLGFVGIFTLGSCKNDNDSTLKTKEQQEKVEAVKEVYEYGLRVDTLNVIKDTVQKNEFVSEILGRYKVSNQIVHNIGINSAKVFDVRDFRAGKPYTILTEKNPTDTIAKYLVYEKNAVEYVVYNLEDPEDIVEKKRPTSKRDSSSGGRIESSLWNALIGGGADPELAVKLSQVYQWTIDFTRIQKNDEFKAAYKDVYIDYENGEDKFFRTDSISSCYFKHNDVPYYAFYFDQGEGKQAGFYDENGESLKRAFLRAPVKYSRISSRYSGRRFHPVQKRYKSHKGTDYAAPRGTPIYATADGTITKATYSKYNGRYVKIKHNSTYSTQYLHMSKIAKGITPGKRVTQGQVIGYVGSTGLATGPHVCYRFWKNGKQVDHLKLDIPAGDPIHKSKLAEFNIVKEREMKKLNAITIPEPSEEVVTHLEVTPHE